jgi:drug/metabolite transporter (DMT)-like permease
MQTKKLTLSPYATLAFGILGLSMTSIFVRWADAPGTVTAAYRMAFSALALTPFVLKKGIHPIEKGSSLTWMILLAGLFVALDHGTLNTAIGLTRIANCTLLNNIAPLWVALFALLIWREKLHKWFWVGLIMTLAGAAIILGSDFIRHPQLGVGDGFALLSSFFYAGYFLLTQSSRKNISALQYMWMVNLVSAVILFAYNLLAGNALFGYSPLTWLIFIGAGIVSQTIGYFSVAHALGHLPASVVAPTMVIQIVLTSLLAIPLTGESLSIVQVAGGLVILAGILLINLTQKQSKTLPIESGGSQSPI